MLAQIKIGEIECDVELRLKFQQRTARLSEKMRELTRSESALSFRDIRRD